MKSTPWLTPVTVALATAWHVVWWMLLRVEPPPTGARPAHQPMQLLLESADSPVTTQGLIRSPVLFALPYGPGFSRYLNRNEDASLPPAESYPDLSALTSRMPSPVTNQWVLAPEAGISNRLEQAPAPPAESAEGQLGARAPAGLHLVSGLTGQIPAETRPDFERLAAATWACHARVEVSASGTVDHVFLEEASGLSPAAHSRLPALLRRLRFSPDSPGRTTWVRLFFQPAESLP